MRPMMLPYKEFASPDLKNKQFFLVQELRQVVFHLVPLKTM